MTISLVKGQRVNFEKGLTRLTIEIGWKINKDANPIYYLDASTFLLGRSGQIENENDFVFYNSNKRIPVLNSNGDEFVIDGQTITRPVSEDGSVLGPIADLADKNNTEKGKDIVDVYLSRTSLKVQQILFTASIYCLPSDIYNPLLAPRLKYNFGQVRDAYIQIKNAVNGEVICRYDLDEDFSTDKGVEFGRLYRRGTEWKFQAIGEAHKDGLEPICRKYASKFM